MVVAFFKSLKIILLALLIAILLLGKRPQATELLLQVLSLHWRRQLIAKLIPFLLVFTRQLEQLRAANHPGNNRQEPLKQFLIVEVERPPGLVDQLQNSDHFCFSLDRQSEYATCVETRTAPSEEGAKRIEWNNVSSVVGVAIMSVAISRDSSRLILVFIKASGY